VRGFALFGVFLMNVDFFNRPTAMIGLGMLSQWRLKRYRYGPLEWVCRGSTCWQTTAMRR
jgi:uncharacterized membrane protein YeiB